MDSTPKKLIVGFERNAQSQNHAHLFFKGERSLDAQTETDAYQKFLGFLDNLEHYKYLNNLVFTDIGVPPEKTPEWQSLKATAQRAIFNLKLSLGSAEDSLMGLRNILGNLKNIIRWGSTAHIEVSKPFHAVVVAAGPSLDLELENLKALKGKALLIAVDASLRTLLENGIEPEIVCCTERGPETFPFFENLPRDLKTLLVGQGTIDPNVFNLYPGPKNLSFKFSSNFLWLNLQDRKLFQTGSSVAHLCYQLAVSLGAESIALVGQDLAYHPETLQTHGRVVGYPLWIEGESLEKRTKEEALYYVPGNFIEKVPTNPLWQGFADEYAGFIANSKVPTFNTSKLGRKIEGAGARTFSDWAARCRESKIQEFKFKSTNSQSEFYRRHLSSLIETSMQALLSVREKITNEPTEKVYAQFVDLPCVLELLMEVVITDYVKSETQCFSAKDAATKQRAQRDFLNTASDRIIQIVDLLNDAKLQLTREC